MSDQLTINYPGPPTSGYYYTNTEVIDSNGVIWLVAKGGPAASATFTEGASGSGSGAVSSVFTRTGAVVATTGDYTVAQITGAQAGPLTGDVTTSGAAATLKNTGTAGTTGDATHVAQVTTDAQGRVTTASAVAITGLAESAVTNLTTDLAAKQAGPLTGDVTTSGAAATLVGTANVESIIRANSLDQMTQPAANVPWNSQRITGLGAAVAGTDAAQLQQTPGVQTLTSSSTFNAPVTGSYLVICVGAGGGGGGGGANTGTTAGTTSGQGGGGGGCGGTAQAIVSLTNGTPVSYTIGTAGTAGVAGIAGGSHAGSSGGNGGNTTFGSTVAANGGGGGGGGAVSNATTNILGGAPGVGTAGSTGLVNALGGQVLQGQGGTANQAFGNGASAGSGCLAYAAGAGGGGGGAGTTSTGGAAGGSGTFAGGGAAGTNANQGTGLGQGATDALTTSYGAGGGGGGGGNNSLAGGIGGKGGPGVIIVIGPLQ